MRQKQEGTKKHHCFASANIFDHFARLPAAATQEVTEG